MLKARGTDAPPPPPPLGGLGRPDPSDTAHSITCGVTEGPKAASRCTPASSQAPDDGRRQLPSAGRGMEVSIAASPPSECNEREGPSTFEPTASTRRPRRTKRPCPPTEKGRMACRPTTRQHKATTQDGSTRGAVTKSFDAGKDQDNHSSAGSRCSSTRCSSSAGSVALSHPLFFVCGERCSSTRCACAYNIEGSIKEGPGTERGAASTAELHPRGRGRPAHSTPNPNPKGDQNHGARPARRPEEARDRTPKPQNPTTETGPIRCRLRHRTKPSQAAEPQPLSRHPEGPTWGVTGVRRANRFV